MTYGTNSTVRREIHNHTSVTIPNVQMLLCQICVRIVFPYDLGTNYKYRMHHITYKTTNGTNSTVRKEIIITGVISCLLLHVAFVVLVAVENVTAANTVHRLV